MKTLTENTIILLTKSLTGDDKICFYNRGIDLVNIFNSLGCNDVYPESVNEAGNRYLYAKKRINEINGTIKLKELIENLVEPQKFYNTLISCEEVVNHINGYLAFEDLILIKIGKRYKIFDSPNNSISITTIDKLSNEFIDEQIKKCNHKISVEDYSGAITNARTLVELVCIHIIEDITTEKYVSDGNLKTIYSKLKELLNFKIDKTQYPDYIKQILSGLESLINGMAKLSNELGDRHANKNIVKRHYAKLAVNIAYSFSDFIVESYYHKKNKYF